MGKKRIVVSLVGITFKNDDGSSRQDLLGALYDNWWTEGKEKRVRLELRAEPLNPHDSNAIGVWCLGPEKSDPYWDEIKDDRKLRITGKLGHVPRDKAAKLVKKLDMIDVAELGKMKVGNKGGVTMLVYLKVKRLVKDTEGRTYDLA